jgi:hypothetical protein
LELLGCPVDLLLSDPEPPDVDGRQLARLTRVVLMSGSHDPRGALLAEPFTDRDLAAAFTAALEGGRAA